MGGVSRIPFSAIDAWARRHDIVDEEFDLYRKLIAELDDEFVGWLAEEAEKRKSKDK